MDKPTLAFAPSVVRKVLVILLIAQIVLCWFASPLIGNDSALGVWLLSAAHIVPAARFSFGSSDPMTESLGLAFAVGSGYVLGAVIGFVRIDRTTALRFRVTGLGARPWLALLVMLAFSAMPWFPWPPTERSIIGSELYETSPIGLTLLLLGIQMGMAAFVAWPILACRTRKVTGEH